MRLITAIVATLFCACSSTNNGSTDGGSGGGDSAGMGEDASARGDASEGRDLGGSGGYSCTTGTLFAGNPVFMEPMMRPTDGTPLLQDPPFPYRTVVFSNGQMITHDGSEIWRANLSDGKLHKIAGTESADQALVTGPCSGALFANIFHIALASDGSLFVSDQTANTILKVTDPLGANCRVSHWAGTPNDIQPGTITPSAPPNVGNTEGPGATAQFSLPERMAIDGSDNVYVWDNGNNSIRKIANDASHTVSTLVPNVVAGGGASLSEVFLGGKLYVWGNDGTNAFLMSVDPSNGAKSDVLRGRADLFGGSASDSLSFGGIVTDGSGLIVFLNGQLFRVTPTGAVSPPLAGVNKPGLDFSSGYDPAASHSAAQVELLSSPSTLSTAGLEAFLGIDAAHKLYVSAVDLDNYVEKIDCAP
jgi:hypothetical protein